jgi:hypothetical protein
MTDGKVIKLPGMQKVPSNDPHKRGRKPGWKPDAEHLERLRKGREKVAQRAKDNPRPKSVPTRWQLHLRGELPVESWDDEEIARGYTKDKDGNFNGRPPNIPARTFAQTQRELRKRAQGKFDQHALNSINVIANVAYYGEKDSDRLKAAEIITERVLGKVTQRIEVHDADPWQTILDDIIDDAVVDRPAANAQ